MQRKVHTRPICVFFSSGWLSTYKMGGVSRLTDSAPTARVAGQDSVTSKSITIFVLWDFSKNFCDFWGFRVSIGSSNVQSGMFNVVVLIQ
jgi:hypothetical protein